MIEHQSLTHMTYHGGLVAILAYQRNTRVCKTIHKRSFGHRNEHSDAGWPPFLGDTQILLGNKTPLICEHIQPSCFQTFSDPDLIKPSTKNLCSGLLALGYHPGQDQPWLVPEAPPIVTQRNASLEHKWQQRIICTSWARNLAAPASSCPLETPAPTHETHDAMRRLVFRP